MEPLRVAVCDDAHEDARALCELIMRGGHVHTIESFERGEAFIATFSKDRYHLVFMDIYMPGVSGLDVVSDLRRIDPRVVVAFVTHSAEHALQSYRLGALKYLVKPFRAEDVQAAMDLAWSLRENRESCVVYVQGRRLDIPLDDIRYVEADNHACHIHARGDIQCVDMRIEEMASVLLPPRFVHCHRSFIVNLDYVRGIDRDFVLDCDERVYIRGKDLRRMKDTYARYLCDVARR